MNHLHRVTPPIRELDIRPICHRKKDDNTANRKARVQCRREDVVVLGPPSIESLVDDLVEYEVDNVPTAVVDTRGRRDVVRTDEDEGPVDLADELAAGLFPGIVRDWWQDEPDPEEMQQPTVDLPY